MTLATALYRGEEWLNRKQAAHFLTKMGCPTTVARLSRWQEWGGPPFTRSHQRIIRYSTADLTAWGQKRMKRVECP